MFDESVLLSSWLPSRSTAMVQRVTSAAIAPMAASCGASRTPTTPIVSGSSTRVRSSCLMMMRRTLPCYNSLDTVDQLIARSVELLLPVLAGRLSLGWCFISGHCRLRAFFAFS